MTYLNPAQILDYWYQAGGTPTNAYTMVAIAWAESSGNTRAVSPTDDYGLWQINIWNFDDYHLTVDKAFDPLINATVAVAMSSDGKDVGLWCTAWAHAAGNCGHYLSAIQKGSPAYKALEDYTGPWFEKYGELSQPPPKPHTNPISARAGGGKVVSGWGDVQHFTHTWARQFADRVNTWRKYDRATRKVGAPTIGTGHTGQPPPPRGGKKPV